MLPGEFNVGLYYFVQSKGYKYFAQSWNQVYDFSEVVNGTKDYYVNKT